MWKGVPDILIPYDDHRRRDQRIVYMKLWWADQVKGATPPPPDPERIKDMGTFLQRDPRHAVLIQTYYDAIEERIPLPTIVDRNAFTTDTSADKSKK
jgi:hypothetical protein